MPLPPWVFLHRNVHFVDGEEFTGGGAGNAAALAAIGKSSGDQASLEEVVAALKPNPVVAGDPPEVASLSMVRHLPKHLMPRGIDDDGGTVSSTDKGLVVIYAGIIKGLGTSAAVLRLRHGGGGGADDGAYVLAELVTTIYPGLPDAHLYLWSSSSNPDGGGGPWRRTAARLPLPAELCGLTPLFHIDMVFALGDSCVCWADLAAGVLICDLFAPQGPEFSFVPLPPECCSCSYTHENTRRTPVPEEFRSMGCVCGAIKLVAMIGYSEGLPKAEVILKTWTLSSDFREWKEGAAVLVRDLWESKSFRDKELPRGWPMNPVLSMNEDEIIYISLSDIEFVEDYDFYGQYTGRQLVLNGHYVLRLDLLRNEVLYSKKSTTNSLSLLRPIVLASDFSAYLHGRKDSQRGKEASDEVGTTVKRTKY
ncbi:uncharacterized protein LOC8074655 [Sorghum bicolor]|uniref:uncharacterized protein LOC8074655 n=1 Tax=Sorghum bicolor TaxID=4558 RepID=UPI000B424DAD|nr:uncharacterized protein LOC8074655 [Sorghum bicolor]|eukprot:XP_021314646.1 uncharacterized protein LOC8074655 [Sorghum bicolor]